MLNLEGRRTDAGARGKIRTLNVLLVGLAVREALSFWTGHLDFEVWVRLGYYVSHGLDPYATILPVPGLSTFGFGALPSIGYPPIWALMQGAVYELYRATGVDSRFLYYFLLKQETILPDVAVGCLILKLLRQWGRPREAQNAFSFWMLSPFLIVISAVWGMFDQLVLFFVLAAFRLSDRKLLNPFAQSVGIVLKVIPVIFLPALVWREKSNRAKAGYLVIAAGLAVAFAFLPYLFFTNWSLFAQVRVESFTVGRVTNSVNYAVVVFVVNAFYGLPASVFPPLSILGYVWIPSIAAAYYFCIRRAPSRVFTSRYALLTLEFVTLVFFLTRLSLPEEYVVYLLAFGILSGRKSGAFRGMWVSATGFLLADNTYLTRFLAPVWSGAANLDQMLGTGLLGDVRYGIMIATAFAFSFFCLVYLRTVYSEIVRAKAGMRSESLPADSRIETGRGHGSLPEREVENGGIPSEVDQENWEDSYVPHSEGPC